MAKIAFNKLNAHLNKDCNTFTWNEQMVEVKQYLSIEEKSKLVERIIALCQDNNNFINEIELTGYFEMEILYCYTNINFTENQKTRDIVKTYDIVKSSGLLQSVLDNMDIKELEELKTFVWTNANHIFNYRNSAYGIIEAINADRDQLELDSQQIAENISNPENLELIKNILTKMG